MINKTPPYDVTIDDVAHRAIERIERAEKLVAEAYYDIKIADLENVTHDPVTALKEIRRNADKERANALQSFGWLVMRSIQGKR